MSATAATLPVPLVKVTQHPLRWMRNKAWTLSLALVLAHVGFLAVAGIYYLTLETYAPITADWHHFSEWLAPAGVEASYLRHMIREVGEGLLGGFLAQQVIWNHYKRSARKLSLKRMRPWRLAVSPALAIVYAIPGFALGFLVVKGLHGAVESVNHYLAMSGHAENGNLWERTSNDLWASGVDKKVIGVGASLFFGRLAMRKLFDEVQLFFVQRRVLLDRPLRLYHPPTFRGRYNDVREVGVSTHAVEHQAVLNRIMMIGLVLLVALAVCGWMAITGTLLR